MSHGELLGVHCSVKGSYITAVEEVRSLAIDTMQIFTTNQRQWKGRQVSQEEAQAFRAECKSAGLKIAFSHASYLVNPASPHRQIHHLSTVALIEEVRRCEKLGLAFAVVHPGSHRGEGLQKGISQVRKVLEKVLLQTEGSPVRLALENTAGQGTQIGYRLEHLSQMIRDLPPHRIAICLDTCHLAAAGYPLHNPRDTQALLTEIEERFGEQLVAWHLNDSKHPIGSRKDRHAHIGRGFISLEVFALLLERYPHLPKVLETPKEAHMDRHNLALLRSLHCS